MLNLKPKSYLRNNKRLRLINCRIRNNGCCNGYIWNHTTEICTSKYPLRKKDINNMSHSLKKNLRTFVKNDKLFHFHRNE